MLDSLSRQQSEVAGNEVNYITKHYNRCGLRRAGEFWHLLAQSEKSGLGKELIKADVDQRC
jgi:hypothetical protein